MTLRQANVYPAVVAVAVLALAASFLLAVLVPESPATIPCALIGSAFVAVAAYLSPRFGIYALLFSAMFTRFELPVGGVEVRPDQLVLVPVLAGIALHVLVAEAPPVGLLILLAVLGTIGVALVQAAVKSGREEGALALALLCGLVSLLVAYQSTNAFWFSYNWIIAAIALKTYESWRKERAASSDSRSTPV